MSEVRYDRQLNIKSVGLREWRNNSVDFNRYEATPYRALERLFQSYKLNKNDKLVDFGCGRGRVAFYIHNRFQIPVTGIEVNELTYEEALNNKKRYRLKASHIAAPIYFEYGLAEQYNIKPCENKFYFFNPFSIKIFRKVVNNILQSFNEKNRHVDIILYYPLPKFKNFLNKETPFRLLNKVRIPNTKDQSEKFLIYRLD